ncbi:MAG TPA: VOC family protein [Thermoanaerobaculia bacterium]|jgi:predicted enzyme related to lactoylglutathione lyase|nr:VOC family protein [Thermoanaerobaculia bacterium]
MPEESTRGRFVWYDLMTTDPEGAKAFYTAVTGWGTQVWEEMSYTMWTVGETPMGGIMKLPEEAVAGGARPHWLSHVAVPDVDATVARARELGATIMAPPTDIPTVGRYSIFTDPQGALIAAYSPAMEVPDPEGMPPVGEYSWHELATTDPEAAVRFYTELFGWEMMSDFDMGAMGVYRIFGRRGTTMGGIFRRPAEMPGPPAWLHYARVADLNAAVEAVNQQGGQVLNGPMEVPGGDWVAQILDPQGGASALHQVKSA